MCGGGVELSLARMLHNLNFSVFINWKVILHGVPEMNLICFLQLIKDLMCVSCK